VGGKGCKVAALQTNRPTQAAFLIVSTKVWSLRSISKKETPRWLSGGFSQLLDVGTRVTHTENNNVKNITTTSKSVNPHDVETAFLKAMAQRSLKLNGRLVHGSRTRCNASNKEGNHGTNDGSYVLYLDDHPAGGFINWTDGLGWEKWSYHRPAELDEPTRERHRRQFENIKAEAESEQQERYEKGRQRAVGQWKRAQDAGPDHPYLVNKQIKPYGIRQDGTGLLLIPIRDPDKNLTSLQMIDPNGVKLFVQGGRTGGGYFRIGKPSETICVAEGYATGASIHEVTGHCVFLAFSAHNLPAVAKLVRERHPEARIVICADDDWKTEGNPGIKWATTAAHEIDGLLAIPKFAAERADGDTDFNDLMQVEGRDAVKYVIDNAESPPVEDQLRAKLDELAKLDAVAYELQRNAVAKEFGVRATFLDKEVIKLRAQNEANELEPAFLRNVEPWDEAVEGSDLLRDLTGTITKHVVLPPNHELICALWILHAHTHDAYRHSPILFISSPTKRCGKTQLLVTTTKLVPRPLSAANITPATIFRAIDRWYPTMLIDEVDTFISDKNDLRGVLNSGHTRESAYVLRCVGDDLVPKQFKTWAPKAFAAIGKLPPTLEDRSIIVELKRKLTSQKTERIPNDPDAYRDLHRKCVRWAVDNINALRTANPDIPEQLNDRARDNWHALLAIADACGDEWATRARKLAIRVSGATEDEEFGVVLLGDLQAMFKVHGKRMTSAFIVEQLANMEDRPWPEYKHNAPITTMQLAALLKPFKVKPKQVTTRDGSRQKQGYTAEQFEWAFKRYAPQTPVSPVFSTKSICYDENNPLYSGTNAGGQKPRKPLMDKGLQGIQGASTEPCKRTKRS
jgi:putative DNA primase/helicase